MSQHEPQPVPQGQYLPAIRDAGLIYTSGMTPRKAGVLIYSGKIRACDSIETYRDSVRLATSNALISAQACLREHEEISLILQLNVFLNAEKEFTAHSKMADYASELLIEQLGVDSVGSRAAIGVATLPADATVEVTLIGRVA